MNALDIYTIIVSIFSICCSIYGISCAIRTRNHNIKVYKKNKQKRKEEFNNHEHKN